MSITILPPPSHVIPRHVEHLAEMEPHDQPGTIDPTVVAAIKSQRKFASVLKLDMESLLDTRV